MAKMTLICEGKRYPVSFVDDGGAVSAKLTMGDDESLVRIGDTEEAALKLLSTALGAMKKSEVAIETGEGEPASPESTEERPPVTGPKPKVQKRVVKKKRKQAKAAAKKAAPPATVECVCENCPFWCETGAAAVTVPSLPQLKDGECRGGLPRLISGAANGKWPVIREDKWCAVHPLMASARRVP